MKAKNSNPYIDAHVHLLDKRFTKDRAHIIHSALAQGVKRMICNTTKEGEWSQVMELSQRYHQIRPYLGVHPWFADTVKLGWLQQLEGFLQNGGGVGEIGLDRLAKVDISAQEKVFIKQLDLATRLKRPVTIHCIKAWGRMLTILQEFNFCQGRVLFHSFGGSKEIMEKLLDRGAFFSFSAAIANPVRKKMRQVFMAVPLDRLLLETDAPDQYVPGLFNQTSLREIPQVNQPQYIPLIYQFAARLRTTDIQHLATTLWKNGQIFTN